MYGGYKGASKLLAEVSASFRLLDSLKLSISIGYDSVRYKAMYDDPMESSSKLASSAGIAYRINDYHLLEAKADNRNTLSSISAKYTHNFGNSMEGFISVEKLNRDFMPDDTQYRFGLAYSFGNGGIHSRLSPLFASSYIPKDTLSLSELNPISGVNTDNFAVSLKKVISKEHIASVNKSALEA